MTNVTDVNDTEPAQGRRDRDADPFEVEADYLEVRSMRR